MRLRLGTVEHDLTTHTLVMGVLPPLPSPLDAVLGDADQMVGQGADLLDVGGLASTEVGQEEEQERLVPVVAALRARLDVPLAVETWRPLVLAEACAAGAVVGRDGGGSTGEDYLSAAAGAGATVVLTDSRLQVGSPASDLVGDVRAHLGGRVARARVAGIPVERIIVDAGLDLGKSPVQSLTLLRGSAALADLGPPLLLDASNRRFLGMILGLEADERRMASHAAAALGVSRGCRIVRAHDVRGARRVADVLEALLAARLVQVADHRESDG